LFLAAAVVLENIIVGVGDLSLLLELLFLGIKGVGEILNDLVVFNLDGSGSLGDGNKGQVLNGTSKGLLGKTKAKVDLFLLLDLQDGVLLTITSTGQEAGDDGTFPSGSDGIVTGTAIKTSGGGVSKDWLVLAGGEVYSLDNLVDLVIGVTETVEGLWPWEFSLTGLVAVFSGSRVFLLSVLLVGLILVVSIVGLVFLALLLSSKVLLLLLLVGLVLVLVVVLLVVVLLVVGMILGLVLVGTLSGVVLLTLLTFLGALLAVVLLLLMVLVVLSRVLLGVVLAGLDLLLEGVGGIEGSVLAHGVVSLTLSVDGVFHGLVEESRFLVGLFGTDRVGLTVQVTAEHHVDSGRVEDKVGGLSFLDVDGPGGETALDLDGVNDALSHGHLNGGLEVFPEFSLDVDWGLVLELSISPSTIKFGIDFNGLESFGFEDNGLGSDDGQDDFVFQLESSVLGIDFRDSGHQASTDMVRVLFSSLPSELG